MKKLFIFSALITLALGGGGGGFAATPKQIILKT